MEALVFWIFAIGLVGTALAVIINRNPVASALCLVTTFIFLGCIFLTLEAFFLAVVQVIVYAGAVMVLFIFIIMLLDIKEESRKPIPWFRALVVGLIAVAGFFVFDIVLTELNESNPQQPLVWKTEGDIELEAKAIGTKLFTQYLLPFEATGVLLLMATIGVIILSRRPTREEMEALEATTAAADSDKGEAKEEK